jgi:hypothetical protein
MPQIPNNVIQAVEEAADIVDVVGEFLDLKKKGTGYTCLCPFHDDHRAGNFRVYPKGNCYRCFACDAKGGPVDFLVKGQGMTFPDAVRWLGKKYGIPVDDVPLGWTPPPPREMPPPRPTLTLPASMMEARLDTSRDTFCTWVRTGIKWSGEQRGRIEQVLRDYHVGHVDVKRGRRGSEPFTAFWQVDADGNIRTAHLMKYKPTGKRMHEEDDAYNTDWLHALLSRHIDPETHKTSYGPPYPYPAIFNPETHEARQCIFGEHLLRQYPDAPVLLVESEKTAVLMAIAYDNSRAGVWMACCGSHNLTAERLWNVMRAKRRIVLYPDRDGIKAWEKKAEVLDYRLITTDTRAVTQWWRPDDGEKADIADVVVRLINERTTMTPEETARKWAQENEGLQAAINTLHLTTNEAQT